jgi:hypothetical protein
MPETIYKLTTTNRLTLNTYEYLVVRYNTVDGVMMYYEVQTYYATLRINTSDRLDTLEDAIAFVNNFLASDLRTLK